jgi:chromosome segregation ATPase
MSAWEDEAIASRLLYKEKPPLRALTQKCLQVEKTVGREALNQLFSEIEEELEAVEYSIEKQHLIIKASRQDHAAFAQQILAYDACRASLASELDDLKQELASTEQDKASLLEYEEIARQLNSFPSQASLMRAREALDVELKANSAEIALKLESWSKACQQVRVATSALEEVSAYCLN